MNKIEPLVEMAEPKSNALCVDFWRRVDEEIARWILPASMLGEHGSASSASIAAAWSAAAKAKP